MEMGFVLALSILVLVSLGNGEMMPSQAKQGAKKSQPYLHNALSLSE